MIRAYDLDGWWDWTAGGRRLWRRYGEPELRGSRSTSRAGRGTRGGCPLRRRPEMRDGRRRLWHRLKRIERWGRPDVDVYGGKDARRPCLGLAGDLEGFDPVVHGGSAPTGGGRGRGEGLLLYSADGIGGEIEAVALAPAADLAGGEEEERNLGGRVSSHVVQGFSDQAIRVSLHLKEGQEEEI